MIIKYEAKALPSHPTHAIPIGLVFRGKHVGRKGLYVKIRGYIVSLDDTTGGCGAASHIGVTYEYSNDDVITEFEPFANSELILKR